jgi:hypothetical protein
LLGYGAAVGVSRFTRVTRQVSNLPLVVAVYSSTGRKRRKGLLVSWVRRRISAARAVPPAEWLLLTGLVGLAVLIRYACRSYWTTDLDVFGEWYDQLQAKGLKEPIGNYNAPFLYLLWIASWLPGATLMKIKLILVAFDVLLVFFVYRIVALRWEGWRIPAVAGLIAAFMPTVVVNASFYGQCDSIWGALCIGALYYVLKNKDWAAVAMRSNRRPSSSSRCSCSRCSPAACGGEPCSSSRWCTWPGTCRP